MSHLEHYDVVILGSREKAEAAIQASEEQGQKVLLIDLDPHTVASLICQKNLSSNQFTHMSGKLVIHQQQVETPLQRITTLVLQPELEPVSQEILEKPTDEELVEERPKVEDVLIDFDDPLVITAQELKHSLQKEDKPTELDPDLISETHNELSQDQLEVTELDQNIDVEPEAVELNTTEMEEITETENSSEEDLHKTSHMEIEEEDIQVEDNSVSKEESELHETSHTEEVVTKVETEIISEEEEESKPHATSHTEEVEEDMEADISNLHATIHTEQVESASEQNISEEPSSKTIWENKTSSTLSSSRKSRELKRSLFEPVTPSLLWSRENSLKDRLTHKQDSNSVKSYQPLLTNHLFERIQLSESKADSTLENLEGFIPLTENEDTHHHIEKEAPTPAPTQEMESASLSSKNDDPIFPEKQEMDEASQIKVSSKKEQPIYIERELRLRKKLTSVGQKKFSLDNFHFFDTSTKEDFLTESPLEDTFNELELDISSKDEKRVAPPTISSHQHPSNEFISDPFDSFTLDAPFAPRRRSKVQKKSRLFASIEPSIEDSRPIELKKSKKLGIKESTLPFENKSFSFEDELMEEFPNPDFNENDIYYEEEKPTETSDTSSSNLLKTDEIEFEDAYGYNSWEEFLTPFSQNSRKRQEMDKIEKRKLALRGLHNLINNLG